MGIIDKMQNGTRIAALAEQCAELIIVDSVEALSQKSTLRHCTFSSQWK